MKSVIIANITWNPDGWRNIYVNRQAGHRYVREAPGHESLNFKFDKPIDKNGKVHGYVQWTYPPKDFKTGGIVIFYSRNLKTNEGEIVGVYGNTEILRSPKKTQYAGFEENILLANIIADETYSMLFPMPLSEIKYKKILDTKRLVPQVGFRIVNDEKIPQTIIGDEITALAKSGIRQNELTKLRAIYEYVTGEEYHLSSIADDDAKEQDELIEVLRKKRELIKDKVVENLKNLKPADSEKISYAGKTYKRDNKTIAELKFLRDFKCQLCGNNILRHDGSLYVEAGHITPKCKKGREIPDNILILCPNHHKEFDLGKKEIVSHSKENIKFKLNDKSYSIDLRL